MKRTESVGRVVVVAVALAAFWGLSPWVARAEAGGHGPDQKQQCCGKSSEVVDFGVLVHAKGKECPPASTQVVFFDMAFWMGEKKTLISTGKFLPFYGALRSGKKTELSSVYGFQGAAGGSYKARGQAMPLEVRATIGGQSAAGLANRPLALRPGAAYEYKVEIGAIKTEAGAACFHITALTAAGSALYSVGWVRKVPTADIAPQTSPFDVPFVREFQAIEMPEPTVALNIAKLNIGLDSTYIVATITNNGDSAVRLGLVQVGPTLLIDGDVYNDDTGYPESHQSKLTVRDSSSLSPGEARTVELQAAGLDADILRKNGFSGCFFFFDEDGNRVMVSVDGSVIADTLGLAADDDSDDDHSDDDHSDR